jgi:hypothetical protein
LHDTSSLAVKGRTLHQFQFHRQLMVDMFGHHALAGTHKTSEPGLLEWTCGGVFHEKGWVWESFGAGLLCGAAVASGDSFPWSACVLQENIPDQSTGQIPASTVPPSKESCDIIPRPAITHARTIGANSKDN